MLESMLLRSKTYWAPDSMAVTLVKEQVGDISTSGDVLSAIGSSKDLLLRFPTTLLTRFNNFVLKLPDLLLKSDRFGGSGPDLQCNKL